MEEKKVINQTLDAEDDPNFVPPKRKYGRSRKKKKKKKTNNKKSTVSISRIFKDRKRTIRNPEDTKIRNKYNGQIAKLKFRIPKTYKKVLSPNHIEGSEKVYVRNKSLKILCTSDLHNLFFFMKPLPKCDIMIVAGDITQYGRLVGEYKRFDNWMGSLKHIRYKIFIVGNHDLMYDPKMRKKKKTKMDESKNNKKKKKGPVIKSKKYVFKNGIMLNNEIINIEGINIYGSPYSFHDHLENSTSPYHAFQVHPKEKKIEYPENIDILVTHGPPLNIGDLTTRGTNMGCKKMKEEVIKKEPRVHLFGHCHEGYGQYKLKNVNTIFLNGCFASRNYKPVNPPFVFDMFVNPMNIKKENEKKKNKLVNDNSEIKK